MFQAFSEKFGSEFLYNNIGKIILESFRDTGDHGDADEQSKVSHYAPDELFLPAFSFNYKFVVVIIMPNCIGMRRKIIEQFSENERIQERKNLVNCRQSQSKYYQPPVGPQVRH